MIGIAVAAYFALSILDQCARADGSASDLTLMRDSVRAVAGLSDHRERTDPGPEAAGSGAADGGDRRKVSAGAGEGATSADGGRKASASKVSGSNVSESKASASKAS